VFGEAMGWRPVPLLATPTPALPRRAGEGDSLLSPWFIPRSLDFARGGHSGAQCRLCFYGRCAADAKRRDGRDATPRA
jgi:hypothetical protein